MSTNTVRSDCEWKLTHLNTPRWLNLHCSAKVLVNATKLTRMEVNTQGGRQRKNFPSEQTLRLQYLFPAGCLLSLSLCPVTWTESSVLFRTISSIAVWYDLLCLAKTISDQLRQSLINLDNLRPTQTSSDQLKPIQTSYDQLRPAT